MDLRSAFAVLRARARIVIVGVLAAGLAALGLSLAMPKVYEADTTLIVGQSLVSANPDYNQILASQRLTQTYATIALTRPLLDAVISSLHLQLTADQLRQQVTATAPSDATLLTITVNARTPDDAANIANAVATQLIKASPALQGQNDGIPSFVSDGLTATQREIEQDQAIVDQLTTLTNRTPAQDAQLATLEGRLVTLRSTYATLLAYASNSAANLLSVIEPATVPNGPSSPKVPLNTAIAAVLGLIVSIGLAFFIDYLDDTVKTSADVEAAASLATLGNIVRMQSTPGRSSMYALATLVFPRSPAAEAFRALRTNVEFANIDTPIRTLLVTSGSLGEGKTTVSTNLAVAFAQAGRRTIYVDADLRRPQGHTIFDLPNDVGLTSLLLSDSVTIESALHPSQEQNLRVLTSGPVPPNPAELLGSNRMAKLLERLMSIADLVVLDSAPTRPVTDAVVLSQMTDATLVVVTAGRSRRANLHATREALEHVGARVIGVALNRVAHAERDAYLYYYARTESTATDETSRSRPAAESLR